ncbi:MAG: LppX_LprAFG lipoprotein [Actinomycetia bacterium]|nr:LppX_LprAFG lipoprotein [Actinomycetes bacterium]MCP4958221.1 LppX_LprAFG lipoprotein [Actinomycetes bacterium]
MQLRVLALIVVFVFASACSADSDGDGSVDSDGSDVPAQALEASADVLIATAADAIAEVTSVHFALDRTGAAVHIDTADLIALEAVEGRWVAPESADALMTVRINDAINTKLGAVAIGEDVWLSNPITGTFEPLPDGYNVDPTEFFDPVGGWRPLLLAMTDVEYVGEDTRAGGTYHLRGMAQADHVEYVTARLVRNQDLIIDMWVETDTALIRSVEFSNDHAGGTTDWSLELDQYDEEMTVEVPEDIRG